MGTTIFTEWLESTQIGGKRAPGCWIGEEFVAWDELYRSASKLAATLTPNQAYLVHSACGMDTIVSLLAVAMVPNVALILGQPEKVALSQRSIGRSLFVLTDPPEASFTRPLYGTPTSGSTGTAKIAIGYGDTLMATALYYLSAVPEYRDAEVLATCSPIDFAGAFYLILLPALFLKRDLVLFPAYDWSVFDRAAAGRQAICLGTPATIYAGSLSVPAELDMSSTILIPAAGYLTAARRERIDAKFKNARYLVTYGSTEMGLVSVSRDTETGYHLGRPTPGKAVWLERTDDRGVGIVCTAGIDCRERYWLSEQMLKRGDGAVAIGDYGHFDDHGNLYLDGRLDGGIKVNGITVYPKEIERHILELAGVRDARVSIDSSQGTDKLVAKVIGDVTDAAVRAHCSGLPPERQPAVITCIANDKDAYNERGKL